MDARTALKNYTRTMVKTYGPNYWENWTEDDRETFNTLVARARKVVAIRLIAQNDNTPFLSRLRGHKVAGITDHKERAAAWQAHEDKHGTGIQGTLSPIRNPYKGNGDSHSIKEYDKPAPSGTPDARISENEWESAERSGNVASMLMARFSH